MEKKYGLSEFGYKAIVGEYAQQADGSVWLQQGGTVILATALSATSEDFLGFLPLMVEYREQFASAGKIPGGYLKREGRPTDNEILTARLIDRAIRPLFPEKFFDKVQVSTTVYSVDGEHTPQTVAFLAASLALSISKIPFMGPLGICHVGRIDGQLVFNPTFSQSRESDIKLIFAGDSEGINMIEGSADEISESDFVDAMFQAHEYVKKQISWQQEIQQDIGIEKIENQSTFDWATWTNKIRSVLTDDKVSKAFTADKEERRAQEKSLEQEFFTTFEKEIQETNASSTYFSYLFDKEFKREINELVFKNSKRLDARDFETVRTITTETGLLPFNHGSAVFQRGRTQALVSATLGGGQDQARAEGLFEDLSKSFMLHYNFPPFSVGEVRPYRGAGRREIGHGYLAASAIERVLPSQEDFPYTIRVVSDILGSDGSSSMATVCGATMALMDAGVPIKNMVSGIAMGLLKNEKGEFCVLTDILGKEDAFGLMDFKVAGTEKGITAIQLDVKHKSGLPRSVFENALQQARRGRLHILAEMKKVLSEPKKELSHLVPQVISFKVPQDKIGAIIGSGGKVIREIIEKTGAAIDIEDDGTVKIFGHPGEELDKAVSWVKTLAGQIETGTIYPGKVKRSADFGLFVEIAPGVDGLVHVSTVPRSEQQAFFAGYKLNDAVKVEVLDYDKSTGRIRLKIVERNR